MRILIPSLVLIAAIGLYINYGRVNSSVAEAEQSEALVQIEIPSELSGWQQSGSVALIKIVPHVMEKTP